MLKPATRDGRHAPFPVTTEPSAATGPSLPPAMLVVTALLLGLGLLGPNGLLAIFAVAVLLAGFALLWRPGEAPILLFVFCLQWLQASTKIFHASVLGSDIGALSPYGGQVELATWLSLLALLALGAGLRFGAGAWNASVPAIIRDQALQHSPKFWFFLYGIAVLVASVAQSFAWSIAGLSQPLLALASMKWAFYWMLAYAVLVRPRSHRRYLAIAFGLEFALSLGGYFSDFKTVLIFTILAVVAAGIRLTPKQYFSLAALGALTLFLGIVWTAVKVDYRNFVSGGEAAQIVTVGYRERLSYLTDLVEQLDGKALGGAAEGLAERLSYVDFFGVVLDMVPDQLPHENGALWWDAVTRPFMPRLFFPEKTFIDDLQRTNYYTGLQSSRGGPRHVHQHRLRGRELHRFRGSLDVLADFRARPAARAPLPLAASDDSSLANSRHGACHRHDLRRVLPRVEHHQNDRRPGRDDARFVAAASLRRPRAISP